MTSINDESDIDAVLSGTDWRIGFCRSGDQRGAYVLLWPGGGGVWDLVLHPQVPFDGNSSEDSYLIYTDDDAAIRELEGAGIEWAPSLDIAERAAMDFFPWSRVAHAARKARRLRVRKSELVAKSVDPTVVPSDPWRF